MEEDFLSEETIPHRSGFLTWLCVLTFIGSGWGILSSGYSYFNADKLSASQNGQNIRVKTDTLKSSQHADSSKAKFAKRIKSAIAVILKPENIRKKAIGDFIAAIFCIVGALFMWKLKRTGFYLYVVGTLIGIALPFCLFGNNFLSVTQAVVVGFFGILFTIFYAMNLKSMR